MTTYKIDNIFVNIINIFFITYSMNDSTTFRRYFEKLYFLAFTCSIIFLNLYSLLNISHTYDETTYIIIAIGLNNLNFLCSLTVTYFGLNNKFKLEIWFKQTNKIIRLMRQLLKVEIKLKNYRKLFHLRCCSCLFITTLIGLIEMRNPMFTAPIRKVKISISLILIRIFLTWYFLTWLMVTCIINCTLMEILTIQFEILAKVKGKVLREFYFVCWLAGKNLQDMNVIFHFSTFTLLCLLFTYLTFGIWVYATTARQLISKHLILLVYSVLVTISLTETGRRVFDSVSFCYYYN